MKLALKIIAIVVAAILLGVVIGVSICVPIAKRVNDNTVPWAELSSWQSMIKDDAPLNRIAIPGSHDSGTKGMAWVAETQSRDIGDQLACGTRYFDIRVKLQKGEVRIFHGPAVKSYLKDILADVRDFLDEHPTEAVILDVQKFSGDGVKPATLELLNEYLADKFLKNESELSDNEFVESLTMNDVRGKCILYWGDLDGTSDLNYVFLRDDDEAPRGGSLKSYYKRSWNWYYSSEKYISKALPAYIEMYKNEGAKGIFVLQGQLTDGSLIAGPRYREGCHEKNMNDYVGSLAVNENLEYINIIMRDFVSPDKNAITMTLNLAKGYVKAEAENDYTAAFASKI